MRVCARKTKDTVPRHPAAHLERALFYHSGEWEKGDTGGGERKRDESVCEGERERREREGEKREGKKGGGQCVCAREDFALIPCCTLRLAIWWRLEEKKG